MTPLQNHILKIVFSRFQDQRLLLAAEKILFESLAQMRNIDKLVRAFKHEDAQTLALIASFLNPKARLEFLYRLPDDLFANVDTMMQNVSNINKDI